jgi:Uma2 family endonuclease
MRAKIADADQMTIEEFLAFTSERPDDERWELVEGVPVLSASPTDFHQIIVTNVLVALADIRHRTGAIWLPTVGLGTRVPASPRSLPQPDVMVKQRPAAGLSMSDEALVLFEVLSPSSTPSDQAWRRKVYASVPNLQHYVTVSQRKVEVVRYDRSTGCAAARLDDVTASLDLAVLGGAIPLAAIYRDTPFGPRS